MATEYERFEAMDRIGNACQILGMMLEDHPAIISDSELNDLIEEAGDCLGRAYQRAGELFDMKEEQQFETIDASKFKSKEACTDFLNTLIENGWDVEYRNNPAYKGLPIDWTSTSYITKSGGWIGSDHIGAYEFRVKKG